MRGFTFAAMSCLMASLASAQIPIHLEGQLGGRSQAIVVSETSKVAYLGVGPRLVTLDVSDPNNVREIARSEVLPEVVQDIVVRDRHAFIANGRAGLYILDVSDRNVPTVVSHWITPTDSTGQALSVCLSGDHAYLANGTAGLQIIDVSNPAEPNRVAVFDEVQPQEVTVSNGYAYVGSSYTDVVVLDVSDPTQPEVVPQSEPLPYASGIEVADGYVYVAGTRDGWRGLYILDAHDPAHLLSTGRCEITSPYRLAITGKLAYVTNNWGGVDIIRITNPTLPSRIGAYDTTGSPLAVVVSGQCAYIAKSSGGLEVVDLSSPTAPVALASYFTADVYDVAISEPYAYVASASAGMQVVDIADPAAPSYLSWLDLDYANCVALGKAHIYVGDSWSFRVIDVTDPAAPVEVASYEIGVDIDDIAVVDRYAFVSAGQGLGVIDVSDPYAPSLAAWCDLSRHTRGLCVANGYAYVASNIGWDIIDISDPLAPVRVGGYSEGEAPYQTAIYGDFAYLARGNAGLQVIDISDPFLPGRVGNLDSRYAHDIAIRPPYALLLDTFDGLMLIDISSPISLALAGGYDVPGPCQRMTIVDNYIYIAGASGGLVILKIDWPDASDALESLNAVDP